jgi:hypothetical protein
VKTGVGGNSTSGGRNATEDDSEKILDATEAEESKQLIGLTHGDELVLLVSSVCRRRLAMRAINWASMGCSGA